MPDAASIGTDWLGVLAALPEPGGYYFSSFKVVLFLLCLVLWGHNAAWVQEDTKVIRVPAGVWTALAFGSGALSLVLWLLVPAYWVGIALYAVIHGGAMVFYVMFRNGRVGPGQTVLTIAHLQRLGKGGSPAEAKTFSKDRTRIKDFEGKTPAWPTDPEEHASYSALQELLLDAIWRRATDVRMDLMGDEGVKVVYRIDGVDRAREPLDGQFGPKVFAHLKRIAGMRPEELRRPQVGRFKATIGAGGAGDKSVDVDAKTSGSTAGQRFILRLIAEESRFRLSDLGLTAAQLSSLQELVSSNKGLIIASGPRNSGITSTLYAMLRSHDAFLQNIHTLEVSKDQDVENITQHVYDSQSGDVSFGKRFRSILRTEPDVCMASDVPDAETAVQGLTSARQGKKIYLGLIARDSFSALQKVIQAVNDNALVAAGLLAITNQRLVRVVCASCRRAYKPDPSILKKANLPVGENRPFFRPPNPGEVEVDKHGNPILCAVCQGSGYLGRTGVFELLIVDDDIRAHIARGTSLPTIKAEARKKGMLYLQEVALHKVYEGMTSINEVLRVTKEAEPAPAAAS